MPSASLLAASGAVPSIAVNFLSLLYVLVSTYVYISLIHQISARTSNPVATDAPARIFGLPEAILAAVLILFLLLNIGASISRPSNDFSAPTLLGNFLLMIFVVLAIVTFLQLRRFDLASLGGFSKISFIRALSTGAILLFFAYPLILWSDIITQRLFGAVQVSRTLSSFSAGRARSTNES